MRPELVGVCEAVTVIGDEALFAGLHARWASPGRRGNSMNVRSSKSAIVSAQITASIPATWSARSAPSASAGSQLNDSSTVVGA